MHMEESENKSSKNRNNSKVSLSDKSLKEHSSDFTSITNLNVLPNTKIIKLLMISTIFNFFVLFGVIIYSFYNNNYLLNISYLTENQVKSTNIINKDFVSIFSINKYMFYILLFGLLFFEFSKLIFIMFKKNCKKLGKFIYMEMGYWFIIIKFFHGLNILLMNFLILNVNFYLNFVISIILTVFTIVIIWIFYKKIKAKRNFRTFSLFFVSIYMSVLLAISIFFLFYNISQLIYYRYDTFSPIKDHIFMESLRITLSIVSFSLQMFISITFLAYTTDLIFSFIMIYLHVGYFVSDIFLSGRAAPKEMIASIAIISVNVLTFLYSVCNHKMEAFGVVKDKDVDEVIDKMIMQKNFDKE